jgi:CheY-like chemotaxis protein
MSHDETDFIPSVLVVSANPDHRARLVDLLVGDGYRVTPSGGAADTLGRLEAQEFDLVVTGILMVHMDGLELLRTIVETIPDLPVIVVGDADPKMNKVYLRCASLLGAAQTHIFPPDPKAFLEDARQAIGQNRIKPTGRRQ